jgi:DNA-binding FadR family transcriptional regulator
VATSERDSTSTRKRAAEEAAHRVRSAILSGELEPGSDLPGERDLSERLGVSRLTLRSAITRLEAEGLVRAVHGSGTRVLDFREHGGVDLVGYLAAQAMEGGIVPFALLNDLLELRRMVAVELVELVAERATDDEIRDLRRQLEVQRELVDDPRKLMTSDLHFARLLVRASHNLAIELLFNTVARIIDQHPGLELAFQANAEGTLAVYDRMLELIESRDGRRAARVARRLIGRLDRVTLQRISVLTGQTYQGT